MSGILERSFAVLEHLSVHPEGCALSALAQQVDMPLSAAHRLLAELSKLGYVRQSRDQGSYVLTIKLASLGLSFIGHSGIADVAQPVLDALAGEAGELVRLAVVDGDHLTFVARAQGAVRGLRYDPDMGLSVPLTCSAAGHAWLASMSDEAALALVARRGFGERGDHGPNAPTSVADLIGYLHSARALGYSTISEVFAPAMTAMGAAVRGRDARAIGVVTIAGPMVRLTEARMHSLGGALMAAAQEISDASFASAYFRA